MDGKQKAAVGYEGKTMGEHLENGGEAMFDCGEGEARREEEREGERGSDCWLCGGVCVLLIRFLLRESQLCIIVIIGTR
jgi:hypothetical protein